MIALFVRYLDLVLMRLPPQAFPASRFLFGVTLLAFAIVMLVSNFILSGDWVYSLVRAVLSVFNLCAGAALILVIAKRSARWQQTATALLGGETVIALIVLPVLLARTMGMENVFLLMSLLLFLAWELVFLAHVYRNALGTGMGTGLLIAVIYVISSVYIKQLVMPFPVPP
ncbi:MAG TPA: hypothetical protein VF275_09165 [Gammaproteobacteria bacterium]